ncbi:hypothetical protein [Stakelama tenebrarum]|uniref:Uncharacterized protein n=1 Tax=Stakelama tenebrarum TaxID=2711215 RepID=A0A6G6Y6A1_9SPHN|nr:hypothetical protein [Sphingosinithalassobacter tenebrarum]QIG80106.1 hypothetical protein G5C33_10160 [Sphingosinithalassobacter tenebrarum]
MTLKATLKSSWRVKETGSPDQGTSAHAYDETATLRLSEGTGAGQANTEIAKVGTIAASGTLNLDLAGGVEDGFGNTVTFTAVKALRIRADAGNTNNLVVGGAVSNPWTGPFADSSDKIAIPPGGMLELRNPGAAGWAVTADTGDILLLANSGAGTGVGYRVEIIGEG